MQTSKQCYMYIILQAQPSTTKLRGHITAAISGYSIHLLLVHLLWAYTT